jgi:hypothetical protein
VDVLKSLQATLHYYEHVANKETPERAAAIVTQTQKLRKIIARIENELESESQIVLALAKKSPRLNDTSSYPNPEGRPKGSTFTDIRRPRTQRT